MTHVLLHQSMTNVLHHLVRADPNSDPACLAAAVLLPLCTSPLTAVAATLPRPVRHARCQCVKHFTVQQILNHFDSHSMCLATYTRQSSSPNQCNDWVQEQTSHTAITDACRMRLRKPIRACLASQSVHGRQVANKRAQLSLSLA